MTNEEFNAKLKELTKEITNLPDSDQKKLTKLAKETEKRHEELKTNIDNINQSLTDLRICIKYLMFDIEATRRERDQLRAMMNNNDN